jgi:hypothetical protein
MVKVQFLSVLKYLISGTAQTFCGEAVGAVRIDIAPAHDTGLDIIVSDTGIGMNAEEIPRALERFGQAQALACRWPNHWSKCMTGPWRSTVSRGAAQRSPLQFPPRA